MASPTRATMRLLSPRLHILQRTPLSTRPHVRHASSRYSNPTKRPFTAVSAQNPTFLDTAEMRTASDASDASVRNPATPLEQPPRLKSEEDIRQYHLRRMRIAGMGLLMCFAASIAIVYNLDLDQLDAQGKARRGGQQLDAADERNASFQGKEVQVIGAGEGKRIVAHGAGEDIELVETGTSSVPHFPRTIYLPTSPASSPPSSTNDRTTPIVAPAPNTDANPGNVTNQEQYTLVGLGIRSVSFLSIQVYVVGLYVRSTDLSTLQARLIHTVNPAASTLIPGEAENLRTRLLDAAGSREIWDTLLRTPDAEGDPELRTAWRISPTRGTDFAHLRDGWVTAISNRTREARNTAAAAVGPSSGSVETEYDAEDFGAALADFKRIFAGGKAPKGSVMILSRAGAGALDVWFQPKPGATSGPEKEMRLLGSVADERISRLIWLGYLAGEKVSSEPARRGVVEGCVAFAGRPVGSVETMVN